MNFPFKRKPRSIHSRPRRDDVLSAYRLILEREAENEGVIQYALDHYQTVEQLSKHFQQSPEFFGKLKPLIMEHRFPADEDPGGETIEVNCDPEAMSKLLEGVEETWSRLGKEDPYWSVLSLEDYRAGSFEENQAAFWTSGKNNLFRFEQWMARNEIALPAGSTCLEFGCGTGRVTRWLAQKFQAMVACDISESHMAMASKAIPDDFRQRVTFFRVEHLSKLDSLPAFDALFSVLVLQHNPPPIMAYVLDKLLARLRPGGIAYFQLPTWWPGYRFVVADYLAQLGDQESQIEMHVLPQRYVFEIASRNGCVPLEVGPDNSIGIWECVSSTFLLQKR